MELLTLHQKNAEILKWLVSETAHDCKEICLFYVKKYAYYAML